MKKLSLHLDSLAVQSFATGDAPGGAGTVHGMSRPTAGPTQSPFICPDTEWWSCGIVCLDTLETNPCNC
ncbi:hypothetical protein [Longimicrobium sp.]|uniref:hypothetical protein n=1 Tax=Longimicrobium sp. TaxID=2029185 RepID=UPI002C96F7AB|nr:hypothetical protein [Longimicrobium sp.]HSU17204.1 hypothetical protein [Longimicrobium sp.]